KLFATLDPTTRRLQLPSGQEVLASDTVGFIAKLPTALVAAFRATLEELSDADLLLHVVDITDPQIERSTRVVGEILADLDLSEKPVLTVLNKADRLISEDGSLDEDPLNSLTPEALGLEPVPGTVLVSATRGWGIERLKTAIEETLNAQSTPIEVVIPYTQSALVDLFRRKGLVGSEEHIAEGTVLRGRVPAHLATLFDSFQRKRRAGV
ncbi:MAG: GTPase, partial [Chloroflexota bacterium]